MILLALTGTVMMLLAILYGVILLTALSGLSLPVGKIRQAGSEAIRVSVIIPARNEENRIIACLESIKRQDYPAHLLEVIVSDDHSEDQTAEVADRFILKESVRNWRVMRGDADNKAVSGKKAAIERAIRQSEGVFILTTDADTGHHPGWVSSMVRAYVETGSNMVLGPVIFPDSPDFFSRMQTMEFLGIMGITAGFTNLGYPVMCNGANLGYKKSVFYETGGFAGNERFASGDDQFMLWKVRQRYGGKSIRFLADREAIVTTQPAVSPRQFFGQRFRWISKNRGCSDKLVLLTGTITYLFQAIIVTGFFLGLLSPFYMYLGISLFCFKVLVDFPLVFTMARFFGKLKLWPWYVPAQLFQVIYVTFSGPLAFFLPVTWKGRKI